MSWLVIQLDSGDVHVVPSDGVHYVPAAGHELRRDCWCVPDALRDGPLTDPIWTHNQPDWPGANEPKWLQ